MVLTVYGDDSAVMNVTSSDTQLVLQSNQPATVDTCSVLAHSSQSQCAHQPI